MFVYQHFTKHFSELRYHFFSKSKGRILDELHVSFKQGNSSSRQKKGGCFSQQILQNKRWLLF